MLLCDDGARKHPQYWMHLTQTVWIQFKFSGASWTWVILVRKKLLSTVIPASAKCFAIEKWFSQLLQWFVHYWKIRWKKKTFWKCLAFAQNCVSLPHMYVFMLTNLCTLYMSTYAMLQILKSIILILHLHLHIKKCIYIYPYVWYVVCYICDEHLGGFSFHWTKTKQRRI